MLAHIKAIHGQIKGEYGRPRIWKERVARGVRVGKERVRKLMPQHGIHAKHKRNGGPLSSTYILTPYSRNPAAPRMVANEHYCMSLADRVGLSVAAVILRRIPESILLIQRFDREVVLDPVDETTVQSVRHLHVIDGCQALDVPVSFKYQRNFGNTTDVRNTREGISFEKFVGLEPYFENPAMARLLMLRWALFQMFIGNSDTHGKKYLAIRTEIDIEPALFDLVSVNAYRENVEQDMAMAYGDAFKLEEIPPYALESVSNIALALC